MFRNDPRNTSRSKPVKAPMISSWYLAINSFMTFPFSSHRFGQLDSMRSGNVVPFGCGYAALCALEELAHNGLAPHGQVRRVSLSFSAPCFAEPGAGRPEHGPSGDPRAFDIRTRKLVWRFHTVPHPGEPGNETWGPDGWQGQQLVERLNQREQWEGRWVRGLQPFG